MKALIIILTILTFVACDSHQIEKIHTTSRETTTLKFSYANKPYKTKEQVGGEQINRTIIKAKKGESYKIVVNPNNDSLKFYIDGSFIQVKNKDNNPYTKKVTTLDETEIKLSFTAHPQSSNYQLTIKKL